VKKTRRSRFAVILSMIIVISTMACRLISAQTEKIVEVAEGKPATASSFYQGRENYSFSPSGIVDRKTNELSCIFGVEEGNTYWLLADHRTGWVQVDIQENLPIVRLKWLNTHNGDCADRATTKYHIALSQTGEFLGEESVVQNGEIEFTMDVKYEEIILSSPVTARYVRFYVDEYYDWGGGLNELQVYADMSMP